LRNRTVSRSKPVGDETLSEQGDAAAAAYNAGHSSLRIHHDEKSPGGGEHLGGAALSAVIVIAIVGYERKRWFSSRRKSRPENAGSREGGSSGCKRGGDRLPEAKATRKKAIC
jgi:hypothetical protein